LAIELAAPDQLNAAARMLEGHPLVSEVTQERQSLLVTLGSGVEDFSPLATDLTAAGFPLRRFAEQEPNLEAAFMAFTKGSGAKI
jgi:ABC-2 type transport system ATP-binding protein